MDKREETDDVITTDRHAADVATLVAVIREAFDYAPLTSNRLRAARSALDRLQHELVIVAEQADRALKSEQALALEWNVISAAKRLREIETDFDALPWQDRSAVALTFGEAQAEIRAELDAALAARAALTTENALGE